MNGVERFYNERDAGGILPNLKMPIFPIVKIVKHFIKILWFFLNQSASRDAEDRAACTALCLPPIVLVFFRVRRKRKLKPVRREALSDI